MTISRRSLFGWLAVAPVALPAAARAFEAEAAEPVSAMRIVHQFRAADVRRLRDLAFYRGSQWSAAEINAIKAKQAQQKARAPA